MWRSRCWLCQIDTGFRLINHDERDLAMMRALVRRIVSSQYRSYGLLERLVIVRTDRTIVSGPFKGTKYVS